MRGTHRLKPGTYSRRQVLGLLAGSAACACCGSVHAQKLVYDLAATEIASGTWAVHGATEYFNLENGGNIVNVAFIEVPDGIVVIDTGPSKRYGEALLALINRTVPDKEILRIYNTCLLYTSPSPRDQRGSRMPSSA